MASRWPFFRERPRLRPNPEQPVNPISGPPCGAWRRRPTLLAIVGRSQSGKTTLARTLQRTPDAVHFSNDYLYYELFRFKGVETLPGCCADLLNIVGGGSAEDVGNFFRTVEKDAALFEDYMRLILTVIPEERMVVSLDLDLRRENLPFAAWIVMEVMEAVRYNQ